MSLWWPFFFCEGGAKDSRAHSKRTGFNIFPFYDPSIYRTHPSNFVCGWTKLRILEDDGVPNRLVYDGQRLYGIEYRFQTYRDFFNFGFTSSSGVLWT
mmetsp:Transcript_30989/g.74850  ORF Transcript_30989/g.74850 Transcript_30989/m.74850 type:complete len:98 (-) Transcript_30989:1078-1371(-)